MTILSHDAMLRNAMSAVYRDGDGQRESLMERAVEGIRQHLVEHRLGPGDRIPTERKLAEQFGVSRTVVRDAIKTLSGLGILEVRDRVGIFVSEFGSDRLADRLLNRVYLNAEAIQSLLDVRQILERSTAEWAAERCDWQGYARLQTILRANRSSATPLSVERFRQSDRDLHDEIARIAGNPIVSNLLRDVRSHLRVFGFFVEEIPEFVETCISQHGRIVDAICANDPIRARDAMIAHLDKVHENLLEFSTRRSDGGR